MNIYNKNWAQYEYSYNLANSRENWAQKIASRVEIEHYSVAYFDRIAAFEAL